VPEIVEASLRARDESSARRSGCRTGRWRGRTSRRSGSAAATRSVTIAEVLESGEAEGELEELSGEENEVESRLGVERVLEVHAPVIAPDGDVVGAYEICADPAPLESSIAAQDAGRVRRGGRRGRSRPCRGWLGRRGAALRERPCLTPRALA
jgi:hypothetical protein